MALGCTLGNSQNLSPLFLVQAGEKAQFDQFGTLRVNRCQFL
jgi:hypothetical protein